MISFRFRGEWTSIPYGFCLNLKPVSPRILVLVSSRTCHHRVTSLHISCLDSKAAPKTGGPGTFGGVTHSGFAVLWRNQSGVFDFLHVLDVLCGRDFL